MAGNKHAPMGPIKGPPADPTQAADPIQARCTATTRQGHRCGTRPIRGGTVCRMHGGGAPQVQAKAKERLAALAPKAVLVLDALLDREEFPTVQFQAARFIAEQEVGKAHESVSMEVSGEVTLSQKIAAARKRLGQQNP